MVAAIAIVVGIILILLVVGPWLFKAVTDIERDIEEHLLDPRTPKVVYDVPNGVDAAVLSTALEHAGFPCAIEFVRGEEMLLVECHDSERERVRMVLDDANHKAYAASGLSIGTVRITDES